MYDQSRILISLHIPKTAGSSLRQTLQGWFGSELELHYRGSRGEPPRAVESRAGLCVHGHFNRLRGIGALQYYPDASQFITFLRNPFDRFVSLWRYLHFQRRSGVAVPELDDEPSFEAWLDRRRVASEGGEDPFSFLAQLPRSIDAANVAEAFGPEFLFVGLMEQYAQSLAALADVLGFPRPTPVHVNRASDAFRQGDPAGDFAEFRVMHEAAFPLEYMVYEAAARRSAAALDAAAD